MRTAALVAGWMLLGAAAQAADDIEALDGDFLEYLANMEADDDDWTLLEDADREPAGDKAQTQPAEKPAGRKPGKEAAKPAVEKQ